MRLGDAPGCLELSPTLRCSGSAGNAPFSMNLSARAGAIQAMGRWVGGSGSRHHMPPFSPCLCLSLSRGTGEQTMEGIKKHKTLLSVS